MKLKNKKRGVSLLLSLGMMFSVLTTSPVYGYYEEPTAEGNVELETEVYDYTKPIGVTMQRLTGPCKTETGNLGDDFLFVIKSGDRYYAMKDVAASESDYESIPAVDVTDWINPDGSLTVPEDTLDVAFWRYEERDGYEYGVFINGREDYLGYSYSYEPTDGDDDYWNDSDRIYSASFEVNTFEEGNWIMDPYYYSENDVSGTLKFNGTWDEKISTYRYITHRYEMITDIRSNGNGGKEFYFRYLGTDEKYTGEEVEGYLYYSDCRHQYTVRHAKYDAPTCMLKGCEEYWYCEGCNEYMKDENFNEHFGQEMPVIPALGHDWDSEKCNNCNRPVPVYSKVTNKADFDALADDTMYILVAEYEGKYYTPDVGEMYLYMMDSNGDGFNDIYDIDDNNNGISDMFEIDGDNDGKYDYLDWDADGDGVITEVDMLEYHEQLCHAYLSDKLYGSSDDIPVKEIKINDDGTISHEEVKDSVEFEMVDLYTEEEIDCMVGDIESYEDWWSDDYLYTYECMKQFVIPNMYITAPSLLPMERQYKQRIADAGDTESWGVLFYNDAEYCKYYNSDLEAAVNVPFNDVCLEDSVAVFSAFDYYWHYNEEQLGQIRLRDYEETLSFVTGQAWELDGWEYVDDENGGYYDTHDTQACVYLYASQQNSHICEFGDWIEDDVEGTHTRTCKDTTCGKTETESHRWNDGEESKAPKCTEAGEKKYTCIDCGATEFEEVAPLEHDWTNWSDDGKDALTDTHTHSCKREECKEICQEMHSWSNWTPDDDDNHKKTCSICLGTRIDMHKWNEGEITTPPTEDAEGILTYTCIECSYTRTESVDKLKHEHRWSDWVQNDEKTHTRTCRCNETQEEEHHFDDGNVINWATHIAPGMMEYICNDCGYAYSVELPPLEEHEWSDWIGDNGGKTHTRSCECGLTETMEHDWDVWTKQEYGDYERVCHVCNTSQWVGIIEKISHEWKQNEKGWWYEGEDGSYPKDEWKNINGKWYYFNKYGYMHTGWFKEGSYYYYFGESGAMQISKWIKEGTKWYYVDESGRMQTNSWIQNKYYVKADGSMAISELVDNGRYYVNENGVWVTETKWLKINDNWYYIYKGTIQVSKWAKVGTKYYYFDETGVMQANSWIQNKYYVKADGSMAISELVDDGKYYVDENGVWVTATKWLKLNDNWYYIYKGTIQKSKWVKIGTKYYYFDESGIMQTNKWINGTYYVKADGSMAVSEWVDNGKYYVGPDGKWVKGA